MNLLSCRMSWLRTYIWRWFNSAACPRCCDTAWVTNEVYGEDAKQVGWERQCNWCKLHWRTIGDKIEYLQPDRSWGEHMSQHKE